MKALRIALLLLLVVAPPASAANRHVASESADSRFKAVFGRWRVGRVADPSRQPLPTDLTAQLARARLPIPGAVVQVEQHKICTGSMPCDEVRWSQTTLAESEYGDGIRKTLGLSPKARVFQGNTDNRFISYALFERQADTVLALVSLCEDSEHARGCRPAYEVWQRIR
jgi:hypothetical protein